MKVKSKEVAIWILSIALVLAIGTILFLVLYHPQTETDKIMNNLFSCIKSCPPSGINIDQNCSGNCILTMTAIYGQLEIQQAFGQVMTNPSENQKSYTKFTCLQDCNSSYSCTQTCLA